MSTSTEPPDMAPAVRELWKTVHDCIDAGADRRAVANAAVQVAAAAVAAAYPHLPRWRWTVVWELAWLNGHRAVLEALRGKPLPIEHRDSDDGGADVSGA